MDKDKVKPLVGLLGILVAALGAEFNAQVTSIALPDVLGGFAISHDPGTALSTCRSEVAIQRDPGGMLMVTPQQ